MPAIEQLKENAPWLIAIVVIAYALWGGQVKAFFSQTGKKPGQKATNNLMANFQALEWSLVECESYDCLADLHKVMKKHFTHLPPPPDNPEPPPVDTRTMHDK